jgi:hypothetical protein
MPHIHIHLQEGFSGEEVRVAIDGEDRMCREARTRQVLSLAFHEAFEVADGPHTVDVAIPSRNIERRIEVEAKGDVHIGLGLRENELRARVSNTAFGYG